MRIKYRGDLLEITGLGLLARSGWVPSAKAAVHAITTDPDGEDRLACRRTAGMGAGSSGSVSAHRTGDFEADGVTCKACRKAMMGAVQ